MDTSLNDQPPARLVAGALAHLATHMETGCTRAAYLAALLLDRVAADPEADDHLRRHARQLVEILDAEMASDTSAATPLAAPARLSPQQKESSV